jgi:triacylglycerol esterase/lipase EstA (alpha/beta hydrolase family)
LKKIFPRISTRGFYNLDSGITIKNQPYHLYPKRIFDALVGAKEITIMIHGLRNNAPGALTKFVIAKKRLAYLGYKNPVVGYSYDSNTTGAQYISYALHALHTGLIIAGKNGRNLAKFVTDFKQKSPETKIRLMGHSLGAHVILSMIDNLARNARNKGIIEAVYFFGGSIPSDALNSKNGSHAQRIVATKIKNYYSPDDEVLRLADNWNWVNTPIGYRGARGKTISKYSQIMVKPKNHRFASYAAVLRSFP